MFKLPKTILKLFVLVDLVGVISLAACSKAGFVANESVGQSCTVQPGATCTLKCTGGVCQREFDYQKDSATLPSDILFVVDNSGSMTEEQEAMATRFSNFLSQVNGLDYHIAVTTTDISAATNPPDANNGYGQLQDGNLIPFTAGTYFLNGQLGATAEQNLFLQTVQRQESIVCKNHNYDVNYCPSGDERGILAAHMAIQRNQQNFIRQDGKLDIVILSDEDERSDGGQSDPLILNEMPEPFLNNVKLMFPKKSVKFHSIIIQPGDVSCYDQQYYGTAPVGNYGDVYADLTYITGGIFGSICASDYGSQLQEIGERVALFREALPCRPLRDDIVVELIPQVAMQPNIDLDKLEVSFAAPLPAGTKVRLKFACAE